MVCGWDLLVCSFSVDGRSADWFCLLAKVKDPTQIGKRFDIVLPNRKVELLASTSSVCMRWVAMLSPFCPLSSMVSLTQGDGDLGGDLDLGLFQGGSDAVVEGMGPADKADVSGERVKLTLSIAISASAAALPELRESLVVGVFVQERTGGLAAAAPPAAVSLSHGSPVGRVGSGAGATMGGWGAGGIAGHEWDYFSRQLGDCMSMNALLMQLLLGRMQASGLASVFGGKAATLAKHVESATVSLGLANRVLSEIGTLAHGNKSRSIMVSRLQTLRGAAGAGRRTRWRCPTRRSRCPPVIPRSSRCWPRRKRAAAVR